MLKKRLIGVITVKQGWAVQSVGYARHLPLGRPEVLAENLDRWGVDEILLQCIDRDQQGGGPDIALLERICRRGLSTPLVYAGGVRSVADGIRAVQAGAERIGIDAALHDTPGLAAALAEPLGAQAVVAVLPLSVEGSALRWYDHRRRTQHPLSPALLDVLIGGAVSEVLLVDWQHEGVAGGFDMRLLDLWPLPSLPQIAFGGLSEAGQLRAVLERPAVVAAAVGNFLSHREHAVQHYKRDLAGLPLRKAAFAGPDALCAAVA
jgi:imidazole glycerol-phosphate synthase subunit HisF